MPCCANFNTRRISARQAIRCAARSRLVSSSLPRVDLPIDESEAVRLSPKLLDLAVSGLAFQFVNDLPGVLVQIRRALKPDGFLLAATIGGETLTELRQAFAIAEAEA